MPNILYAQIIPKTFPRFYHDMQQICPIHSLDLPNNCNRYAQDMPKIYPRYAQDMLKLCPGYIQELPIHITHRYNEYT